MYSGRMIEELITKVARAERVMDVKMETAPVMMTAKKQVQRVTPAWMVAHDFKYATV